ncbi:hypothetical protein D9M71_824540 [compost metagenome]
MNELMMKTSSSIRYILKRPTMSLTARNTGTLSVRFRCSAGFVPGGRPSPAAPERSASTAEIRSNRLSVSMQNAITIVNMNAAAATGTSCRTSPFGAVPI